MIHRLLDQLLETICDVKITGFPNPTVNQDKECITVAALNLLHLQVSLILFLIIRLPLFHHLLVGLQQKETFQ